MLTSLWRYLHRFQANLRSKMATEGKLQDDFLTCSVCMEVYQRPITLTCQHSFCEICLGQYLQTKAEALRNKSIPCPTCRQETPVPRPDRPVEEWAGQLKPRLLLTELMDTIPQVIQSKSEAVRNKSIPCPTCRQETPVPHPDRPVEEWAGQLKPGLLLTGLIDSVGQGSEHCRDEEKTTPARHLCGECEPLYCDGCLKLHKKMPISKTHEVVPVTERKYRQKKFVCKEHDKEMKLYCRDCDKPVCTVCCSIDHRTCKEVITIKAQSTEVKSKLQESQQNLDVKIYLTNGEIQNLDLKTKNLLTRRSKLESNVRKIIKEAIDTLKQKEEQLIEKVTDQTEQDKEQLRSMMKTKQMDLQLYQQQSQSIQQALELEDEAQLFEMYLSSGSGADVTVTQRKDRTDIADISFKHNLAQLKEHIEMMDVMINKVDLNIQQIDNIDLTAAPVLDEVIDAKLNAKDRCGVTDGLVMTIERTKFYLFADCNSKRLKSIYTKGGKSFSSVLKVSGMPWCLTVISEGTVAVSLPWSQHIIIVAVTPDLELLSTIQTRKNYLGLSTLDQSTLVAGSDNPSSVDLIDMQGTILKTFTTLPTIGQSFIDPHYIHVTRQGTILVSDKGLKSVLCLTRSGDIVFTYTPTGDRALGYPRGITSTSRGDILLADCDAHKVIYVSQEGEFLREILTLDDGLHGPTGLCFDGNQLCVVIVLKGFHKYKCDKMFM